MKRHIFMAAFLLAATLAPACTNFIVGRQASADGSVICTYNA
ncbi:C69 family dipeptidase, partial [Hallella bergensis]